MFGWWSISVIGLVVLMALLYRYYFHQPHNSFKLIKLALFDESFTSLNKPQLFWLCNLQKATFIFNFITRLCDSWGSGDKNWILIKFYILIASKLLVWTFQGHKKLFRQKACIHNWKLYLDLVIWNIKISSFYCSNWWWYSNFN